ncbi:MAG: hypothetical protein CFE44_18235 [Burkholderiales bacterium PBB4]|nr:MAG: hypothetical protein CFE44_18235 [Burkholderiales bacterium PBB4]
MDALDLAYGRYLYAFPIQQALKQTFPQDDGWLLLLKTLPLCLVCAFLSWYCIERPAKAWRKAPSSTQPTMGMSDTLHLPLV